jgi:hypothetical protein
LKQVLKVVRTLKSTDIYHLRVLELMRVLVEAGATLTHSCFFLRWSSTVGLQGLVDLGGGDILTWIQDGLLASAVIAGAKRNYNQDSNLVLNWILSSLKRLCNQKNFLGISTDDDDNIIYPALVAAFNAALESSWDLAIETIYDTCQQLGYAAYCNHVDSYINSVVMQACIDRDWAKATRAVPQTKAEAISHQSTCVQHDDKDWDEYGKIFDEAMLAEDVQTVEELLDEYGEPGD